MSHFDQNIPTEDELRDRSLEQAAQARIVRRHQEHSWKIIIGIISLVSFGVIGQYYGVWEQLSTWTDAYIGKPAPAPQTPPVNANPVITPATSPTTKPADTAQVVKPRWQTLNDDELLKALHDANYPAQIVRDGDQEKLVPQKEQSAGN